MGCGGLDADLDLCMPTCGCAFYNICVYTGVTTTGGGGNIPVLVLVLQSLL